MTNNIVVGSQGMVGYALMSHLSDAVGTYHNGTYNPIFNRTYEFLDITEKPLVDAFFAKHRPQKVFIAAANPHVDGCENISSDKVNINGISSLIENCSIYGSQVIFFSSSYVFDGKSQTPYKTHEETNPINRYGRQKEQIEKKLKETIGLSWVIIRTVGVFGTEGIQKNFVSQVKKAVRDNKRIHVPVDQTMNPVYAKDLARVTVHIANRFSNDIFHVAGNRCISKYEFAIQIAYKLGCKKPHDLIVGMKSEDMKQIAPRPANGCLDIKKLETLALPIPNYEKGLKKYLEL